MPRSALPVLSSIMLLTACGTTARREQKTDRDRLLMAIRTSKACAAEVRARPDIAPYLRRVVGPDGNTASGEQMAETALPNPEEAHAAGAFGRAMWRCDIQLAQSMRIVSMQMGQIASNMNEDRRM